jgi:hypothetical protein
MTTAATEATATTMPTFIHCQSRASCAVPASLWRRSHPWTWADPQHRKTMARSMCTFPLVVGCVKLWPVRGMTRER